MLNRPKSPSSSSASVNTIEAGNQGDERGNIWKESWRHVDLGKTGDKQDCCSFDSTHEPAMIRLEKHGSIPLRVVAGVFFIVLSSRLAYADKVDDFILGEMKRHQIPGLSVAVSKKGRILKTNGYGFANLEWKIPATPETVYQLASITKCFTATAIMQLVEDGKLTLEDKVSTHIPGLPRAWSNVTVWHLLTHSSGIKSYTQFAAIADNPQRKVSSTDVIGLVADLPLEFQPGERYDYSNTGYYLLGMLIEKRSGQSYGAFLEKRIFKPAAMADTRVNDFSEIIPRRAAGYVLRDGGISNGVFVHPSQPFAAGALITTVSDLARWDAALYTDKLLKQSTLQQMWTPADLGPRSNYGLGWGIQTRQGRRHVQHNGGIIGFSTHMRRGLDDGLTIIVLANLSGRGIYAEQIAEGVAPFYLEAD